MAAYQGTMYADFGISIGQGMPLHGTAALFGLRAMTVPRADATSAPPGFADSAVFSQGKGTYDGHDVVARPELQRHGGFVDDVLRADQPDRGQPEHARG